MNVLLLIVSILLYASFGWKSLFYVFFSIITTFIAGKHLNGKYKKVVLIGTITINLAILIFMKVLPYTKLSIIAPLGISYYTLQIIAYLVDVYKGKYKPEESFFNFTLFIMYIPHLFIGPISRYEDMKETLLAKRKITANNIFDGLIRVCWGLIKKFVIAGRTAILIATISGDLKYSGAYAFLAMIIYSINLYADFSGGIDIVMGVSKMLGIDLKENFNSPYYSQSIKEFWRRWHISLSSWLKDYVYIPLGGNRKGTLRKNINLLITFKSALLYLKKIRSGFNIYSRILFFFPCNLFYILFSLNPWYHNTVPAAAALHSEISSYSCYQPLLRTTRMRFFHCNNIPYSYIHYFSSLL